MKLILWKFSELMQKKPDRISEWDNLLLDTHEILPHKSYGYNKVYSAHTS